MANAVTANRLAAAFRVGFAPDDLPGPGHVLRVLAVAIVMMLAAKAWVAIGVLWRPDYPALYYWGGHLLFGCSFGLGVVAAGRSLSRMFASWGL